MTMTKVEIDVPEEIVPYTVSLYVDLEDFLQKGFETEVSVSLYLKNIPNDAEREYLLAQIEEVAQRQNRKLT